MENKAWPSHSTTQVEEEEGNVAREDPFAASQSETLKMLTNILATKFASLVPDKMPNSDLKSLIEESLQKLAPSLHTPTHPAYDLMIYTAIDELEGNGGSTHEEAISKFIKEKFEDLPLTHHLVLKQNLKKLCENKEIVHKFHSSYTLAEELRRKWKWRQELWRGSSRELEIVAEEWNGDQENDDEIKNGDFFDVLEDAKELEAEQEELEDRKQQHNVHRPRGFSRVTTSLCMSWHLHELEMEQKTEFQREIQENKRT